MSMKLEIDTTSIKNLESDVRKAFQKVIQSPALLDEVGQTVTDDIKFQTRRGYNAGTGDKLKALSAPWIKQRKRLAQGTEVDSAFSPARSNLTITGKLLDSLTWKRIKAGSIELYFKGTHNAVYGYKLIRGAKAGILRTRKSKISNEKLAQYVQETRPFVGVRALTKKKLNRIVVGYIRRAGQFFRFD